MHGTTISTNQNNQKGPSIMQKQDNIVRIPTAKDSERDAYVLELQRLLACYQLASAQDKNVVWAVLNKYAPRINDLD